MAWAKGGDNAGDHPVVLAANEDPDADDRLLNELFGFAMRCYLWSASHTTDYLLRWGTVVDRAGGQENARRLTAAALRAGYFAEEFAVDGVRTFKLLDDPEFLHLRTREELEFERQRRNDNSNPALTVPVTYRDGDACRYCGQVVDTRPGVRSGRLGKTYDHTEPGRPATVETYVVACRRCNSSLKDQPRSVHLEALLPAPERPYYSPTTIEWINNHSWAKANQLRIKRATPKVIVPGEPYRSGLPRPGFLSDHAKRPDQPIATPSGIQPDEQALRQQDDSGTAQRPGCQPDHASPNGPDDPAPSSSTPVDESATPEGRRDVGVHRSDGSRRDQRKTRSCGNSAESAGDEGTASADRGRDGTGRDGPVREGGGSPPPQVGDRSSCSRRRRGRRGGRKSGS